MIRKNHRSLRLKGYDYAQTGTYFVTICTPKKQSLFGEVVGGEMVLNDVGRIIQMCWSQIPNHSPQVILDAFVIMPDHIHGSIIISPQLPVGAKHFSPNADVPHTRNDGAPYTRNDGAPHAPNNVSNGNGELTNLVGAKHFSPNADVPYTRNADVPYTRNDGVPYTPHEGSPYDETHDIPNGLNGGLTNDVYATRARAKHVSPLRVGTSQTIGSIVRGFKIGVTKHVGYSIWQCNYYEHIIQNDMSFAHIRHYIANNSKKYAPP
jgi:putative transposase